jgi:E3 ubiquitin-protein ligase UBR1
MARRRLFAPLLPASPRSRPARLAAMSGLSSFLGRVIHNTGSNSSSSSSPRERAASDPGHALRSALETLPAARAHVFTPAARAALLGALYESLFAGRAELFVPAPHVLAPGALLGDAQARARFHGAGAPEPPLPGRPCAHIFAKGESCFRCKCVLCCGCDEDRR